MAPGVCVTSFRMLIRRTELSSHLCRGLRLTPSGSYLMNSWSTRSYCKKQDDASIEEQQQRQASTSIDKEGNQIENGLQQHKVTLDTKPTIAADDYPTKEDDLTQLKLAQLRTQLRAHGLSGVGKKDVLVQRLQSYLALLEKRKKLEKISNNVRDEEYMIEDLFSEQFEESPSVNGRISPTKTVSENVPEDAFAQAVDQSHIFTKQYDTKDKDKINIAVDEENMNDNNVGNSEDYGNIQNNYFVEAAVENADKGVDGDVYVEYIQGLPHLTVPLPSRAEKCRFALRPVSHKVSDLIEMLKIEDHGIDRAIVLNKSGVRIASTCAIDSLLDEPFWLQINDNRYEVIPPKRKKIDSEDLKRLSDVRTLVAQLYEALHVGEYHLYKEQELVKKIENLKFEISPLEMEKEELTKLAERKTVIATWVGLSLMAVQFGVLARLTWWEYSWDIMEPVTYFVTYGTTMAMYAYYCLTKSEYAFESIRNRLFLISIHKKAKKKNFDVDKFNMLKRQIAEAEYDLRRLRDPINLQLPPHIDRSQRITSIEPPSAGGNSDTRIVTTVRSDKKPISFRLPFLEPKN